MSEFDKNKSIEAQKKYCKEKRYPHFAPSGGHCWSCGRNIYEPKENKYGTTGITLEQASNQLVTGCPHCHRSYCD